MVTAILQLVKGEPPRPARFELRNSPPAGVRRPEGHDLAGNWPLSGLLVPHLQLTSFSLVLARAWPGCHFVSVDSAPLSTALSPPLPRSAAAAAVAGSGLFFQCPGTDMPC
jgi:hypothetical protein